MSEDVEKSGLFTDIETGELKPISADEYARMKLDEYQSLLANGNLYPVGYRICIKPIEGTTGMEGGQAEQFTELAKLDFQTKTDMQAQKEERGEDRGIVMGIGPEAFARNAEPWCKEGDLVVFRRYSGTYVEHPKGTGHCYYLINDEDIFGVITHG